jgi:hypothetical protein
MLRLAVALGGVLSGCVEPLESPEPAPVLEPSEQPWDEPVSFPPAQGTEAGDSDTYWADCGHGMTFALADLLQPIALGMVHQGIPYARARPDGRDEWRDCSGNFLRLSSYLASACPGSDAQLAAPAGIADWAPEGDNAVALVAAARSSRDLARWYHEQGRFAPVFYDGADRRTGVSPDLERYRHLIKPGAVLWFSEVAPRAADGIEPLFGGGRSRIRHMATVVRTELDEDGQVVAYEMYHGRNGTHLAGVSEGRRWTDRPPLGNGGQYLVGIGALVEPMPPP